MGSRWRTDFPAAEAAAAMIDSCRPVPTMIRSKVVGSMGGNDVVSSFSAISQIPLVTVGVCKCVFYNFYSIILVFADDSKFPLVI